MEYKKDGEKFAFGVGVDKVLGSGKVSEAVPLTGEKSEKNDSLPVLIAEIAAAILTGFFGMRKAMKKRKRPGGGKKRK